MAENDTDSQSEMGASLQKLLTSAKSIRASVLTAAIVAAAGRPYSIGEVLDVLRDVDYATNPHSKKPEYAAWLKNKDETLAKIHN
ncbi:MAG: hypothetical protein ABI306_08960 [Caulobacteraceae bacterium]